MEEEQKQSSISVAIAEPEAGNQDEEHQEKILPSPTPITNNLLNGGGVSSPLSVEDVALVNRRIPSVRYTSIGLRCTFPWEIKSLIDLSFVGEWIALDLRWSSGSFDVSGLFDQR